MVTVGRLEAVGNRLPIHYAFEGGFVAGEEAADNLDAVVFLQFEFAGGGYFVVGGEMGDCLLYASPHQHHSDLFALYTSKRPEAYLRQEDRHAQHPSSGDA